MSGNHDRLHGRNGKIWRDYVRLNMTQDELAERYGLTQQRVSQILAEIRREIGEQSKADIVAEEIGYLRDIRAQLTRLMDVPPPPVTAGKDGDVVLDPTTGEPVRDYTVHIRAADSALRYAQRLHAVTGLDEAVKVDVGPGVESAMQALGEAAAGRLMAAEGRGGEDE